MIKEWTANNKIGVYRFKILVLLPISLERGVEDSRACSLMLEGTDADALSPGASKQIFLLSGILRILCKSPNRGDKIFDKSLILCNF